MDPNSMQQRMQEIQEQETFVDAFSKIISGKPGYKPVIEKKQITLKCLGCQTIIQQGQKFCHECGMKIEYK